MICARSSLVCFSRLCEWQLGKKPTKISAVGVRPKGFKIAQIDWINGSLWHPNFAHSRKKCAGVSGTLQSLHRHASFTISVPKPAPQKEELILMFLRCRIIGCRTWSKSLSRNQPPLLDKRAVAVLLSAQSSV